MKAWLWWPVDKIGSAIVRHASIQNQVRVGVLMFLIGLPYMAWTFKTKEPKGIYSMSALALVIGGVSVIIAALPSIHQCSKCGHSE